MRAFYLKNFALAAENFDKAGRQSEEKVRRTERQLSKDKLDVYQNWKLDGNSLSNLYRFSEALERYGRAQEYVSKEKSPEEWAEIKVLAGNARQELGIRVEGDEGPRLLLESLAEYHQVLTVYTREQLPQQWEIAQNNLANAYFALQNWAAAVEAYAKVLAIYPDHTHAYSRVSFVYHEVLFKFREAYQLNQQWLIRHPDHLSAHVDFAEKHFTTGRFNECAQRITSLLVNPEVKATSKAALRAVEIATLLALKRGSLIQARLDALIESLGGQPLDFKLTWSFAGILHFIGQEKEVTSHRDWLHQLFSALQKENREAILKALREVRANFKG